MKMSEFIGYHIGLDFFKILMRLHEDDPICGPKHVATNKQNQCEQFDWFIFIVALKAKYHQS
jgi:hypothetical protein